MKTEKKLNINFYKKEHRYEINGKEAVSVTTLLSKVGITKDYSKIPKNKQYALEWARERGNYYDDQASDAFLHGFELTPWQKSFLEFLSKNDLEILQEQTRVGTDTPYPIAGTLDFLVKNTKTNKIGILDLKATAAIYLFDVTWQTNFYSYLFNSKEHKNTDKWVLHYDEKSDNFTLLKLEHIEEKSIQTAIEAYQLGERYDQLSFNIEEDEKILRLLEIYEEKKELKKEVDKLNKEEQQIEKYIKEKLKTTDTKTVKSERIQITYTPPGTRTSVSYKGITEEIEKLKYPIPKELLESNYIAFMNAEKEFKENIEKIIQKNTKISETSDKLTITVYEEVADKVEKE